MASSSIFKCPSCGASLTYQPGQGALQCPYCGNTVPVAQLEAQAAEHQQQTQPAPQPQAEGGHFRAYHCQMCGAEIVTDDTTAATHCYYCHSPVVLDDRLSGAFHPDGVIPFQMNRQEAEAAFDKFIRGHRFVDKRFFSPDQREMLSGVYYPYWLGEFTGDGSFDGTGTRVSTMTTGREIVTTTRYFQVRRAGTLRFHNVVRKGLSKQDRLLSDGIHPYTLQAVKPFTSAYLSGFLAEKWDVPREDASADMEQEVTQYAPRMMQDNSGFNSLKGKTGFRLTERRLRYVLMPAWVLVYKGEGKNPSYYLMNGQTGKVCGKLPVNRGRLALWCAGLGALVCGLMCAGGALLW